MELDYGSGYPAALLDLTNGKIIIYSDNDKAKDEVHSRFGGKQFYRARSGLSGAAFVPNNIALRKCAVLRTDDVRPAVPSREEALPGTRIVVPTKHIDRAKNTPVIVVRDPVEDSARGECDYVHEVYFVPEWELPKFLRGEWTPSKSRELVLTGWRGDFTLYEYRVKVILYADYHYEFGKLGLRRVLELLFWDELYDAQSINRDATTEWHRGLGLVVGSDNRAYHSAGGVLRRRADMSMEALQAACPWVKFVPGEEEPVYLSGDGSFRLVHPRDVGDVFRSAGMTITNEEAMRLLMGGVLPDYLRLRLTAHLKGSPRYRRSGGPTSSEGVPNADTATAGDGLADWERELMESQPATE